MATNFPKPPPADKVNKNMSAIQRRLMKNRQKKRDDIVKDKEK